MAVATNISFEYESNDVALTSANAIIMPEGTTSYTVASGHVGILARKVNNYTRFHYFKCSTGASKNLIVQTGDAVWDLSQNYDVIKFSTGGNSFVNMIERIPSVETGETDTYGYIIWNGALKISGF